MTLLTEGPDTRYTREENGGPLRTFFDPRRPIGAHEVMPYEPMLEASLADPESLPPELAARQFLKDFEEEFRIDPDHLVLFDVREIHGLLSVRFQQQVQGVPVYDSFITINIWCDARKVISAYNNYDYELPSHLDVEPRLSSTEAGAIVNDRIGGFEGFVEPNKSRLFIYRHDTAQDRRRKSLSADRQHIERFSEVVTRWAEPGDVYLVWRLVVKIKIPYRTNLEILVETRQGNVIYVKELGRHAKAKAFVFMPDPVTSSDNDALRTDVKGTLEPAERFLSEIKAVELTIRDPGPGEEYELIGEHCVIQDLAYPTFSPPLNSEPNFSFRPNSRHFLGVMAYFWIDDFQRYLRHELDLNNILKRPIEVDPQGIPGDNSCFVQEENLILFGEGGSPDAADAAVILHEYGHAIQHDQGFPDSDDLEEGWSDAMARIYLDRFTPFNSHFRTKVFPLDADERFNESLLDRTVAFDWTYDRPGFDDLDFYEKGSVWATNVWQIYLDFGGDSEYLDTRKWAAAVILRIHLAANVIYGKARSQDFKDFSHHRDMGESLKAASYGLAKFPHAPPGILHKVIHSRLARRGLLEFPKVDVFIDDGRNGQYHHPKYYPYSSDLIVNRHEEPSPVHHEEPLVGQDNYLWAKVKRSGHGEPEALNVTAYTSSPEAEWPAGFTMMETRTIHTEFEQNESEIWAGPFKFKPQSENELSLVVVVDAPNDPSILKELGNVSVVQSLLCRFDNNFAQRDVRPET